MLCRSNENVVIVFNSLVVVIGFHSCVL